MPCLHCMSRPKRVGPQDSLMRHHHTFIIKSDKLNNEKITLKNKMILIFKNVMKYLNGAPLCWRKSSLFLCHRAEWAAAAAQPGQDMESRCSKAACFPHGLRSGVRQRQGGAPQAAAGCLAQVDQVDVKALSCFLQSLGFQMIILNKALLLLFNLFETFY